MKRTKRKIPPVIAAALIISTLLVLASTAFAATDMNVITGTPAGESIHEKIDISDITGEIVEPPELTSAASSLANEKEWYEYVYYSTEPVGYYYLTEKTRLAYYDPYDYASSLIMEVDDSITDWSSMNTLQVSYTTGSSITDTSGKSTDTSTSIQVADGDDVSTSTGGGSTVTTTVEGRVDTYNKSKTDAATDVSHEDNWHLDASVGSEIGTDGKITAKIVANTSDGIGWSDVTAHVAERNSEDHGWTEDNTTTTSKTTVDDSTVTSVIAKRITNATGSGTSSSISMSTENSTTITKTYDAAYFNASGSPLQWKIIKYTVLMPMKYQVEYLIDDEWVFGDYGYCLLTTIQGTCRSWLQNNVAYYEHWGTGEPVTWDEFWSQFFTKENLIKAYQSKLYPEN